MKHSWMNKCAPRRYWSVIRIRMMRLMLTWKFLVDALGMYAGKHDRILDIWMQRLTMQVVGNKVLAWWESVVSVEYWHGTVITLWGDNKGNLRSYSNSLVEKNVKRQRRIAKLTCSFSIQPLTTWCANHGCIPSFRWSSGVGRVKEKL
jgi:hypothetical protein